MALFCVYCSFFVHKSSSIKIRLKHCCLKIYVYYINIITYIYLFFSPVIRLHYIDVGTHGINAIYVLLNIFITGIPVRIQHFWHCLVFGVVYIIFSVIYDVSGGTNARDKGYIYSVLDWDEVQTTIIYAILVGVIGPILIWLIVYGLYWIRIAIFRGCKCTNYHHSEDLGSKDVILGSVATHEKYGTE